MSIPSGSPVPPTTSPSHIGPTALADSVRTPPEIVPEKVDFVATS